MSFKSGITEASKKNEEKMKGSTQGFSGDFCGSFFFGWLFFLLLVGWFLCVWAWWGFVVFYNLWGILF